MTSLRAATYRLHWEVRSRASGFGLLQALRLLEESQWWERSRLDALRDEKLVRLVGHAYAESPFYRQMMDECGVRPADVRGLADLSKLPVLTKETLRQHGDALRFRGRVPVETVATGGTTGNPITVVRDRAGSVWQRGCYWRGLGWGGLRLGEPFVQLFGGTLGYMRQRRLDRVKNWLSGRRFLPAFELGPQNAVDFLEAIRRSRAKFLVGYASAAYILATHAEKKGTVVQLDAVFPTAELILDSWRAKIAHVFGAKVMPYYGCGEIQSLAYTCPISEGTVYHTCDEHAVIEVEGPDGKAGLAGEGPFLITDLDNHALPMLRYRNGDAGAVAPPGCACGRGIGRITRLDGRVNDVLYATSGAVISGVIGTHTFKVVEGVEQFQIIQRRAGHVAISIVRAASYDPAEEEPKIEGIFRKYLGSDADVEIRYVDSIPPTAAGKARFMINEVASR